MVVAFLVVEVIGGLLTNSLALLADAGHMFTDAAGIGLALLAIWFARRPATAEKSFGYYRIEIFAAVTNAVILFVVAGFILYEAIQRFSAPPEVLGLPMLGIASVGLVVNLVSMRLLQAGAETSLNLRGAYLEVLGDLLGSVAVIVAGLVIILTGWTPIDPIASVVIAAPDPAAHLEPAARRGRRAAAGDTQRVWTSTRCVSISSAPRTWTTFMTCTPGR